LAIFKKRNQSGYLISKLFPLTIGKSFFCLSPCTG
jgi:hypothetical protein